MAHESLLRHHLNPIFPQLALHHSTSSILASPEYVAHETEIKAMTNGIEYGFYAPVNAPKNFYRMTAWNLERGIMMDEQIDVLKNHPILKNSDVLFLTETDIGMARTHNRNVARDMAQALGMNYFFATSYLNLCKGNSIEDAEGDNELGLHGNALLSRYPISNMRIVPLFNCKDKMRGKEKRLGCQKGLVADIEFPQQTVTVAVAHLDAHSSQKQRAGQMELILKTLENNPYPVLVGGDLNTSTYDSSHAFYAFCGFWDKVFRGVRYIIEDHYPYPDRFYEKPLFDVFTGLGYDYKNFNALGVGTLHYTVDHIDKNKLIQEVVPGWCRRIMEETLRRNGGKVSLKLDWFAAKGLKIAPVGVEGAEPPMVIGGLKAGGEFLSDHDPIVVDIRL
ncbi:endonuclease/exonuclease/phosphatase family protein [bacterium]|nr:endonuclease/exonuclease/phosphatase family protein [bacterium]